MVIIMEEIMAAIMEIKMALTMVQTTEIMEEKIKVIIIIT